MIMFQMLDYRFIYFRYREGSFRAFTISKILRISLFVFFFTMPAKELHVFGDSHSAACFSNVAQHLTFKYPKVRYYNTLLELPVNLNWLGPVTMHRIGRDGLNLKNYNIKHDDIVLFVFGEIDVRCHILKQVDTKKRALKEVVKTLVDFYVNSIVTNRSFYPKATYVVLGVIPTRDNDDQYNNVKFPFWGTTSQRIEAQKYLNYYLQSICKANNILFCPFPSDFYSSQGYLKKEMRDHNVHIHADYRLIVQRALKTMLT